MLTAIFKMQRDLNIVIGRDTVGATQEERDAWLFGYAFACVDEFYELEDSLDDPDNAVIEAIDIMHFIVSIYHILNITPEDLVTKPDALQDTENPYALWNMYGAYNKAFILDFKYNVDTFAVFVRSEIRFALRQLNTVMRNVDWKWWSKTVKEDPSRQFKVIMNREPIVDAAKSVFTHLVNIFGCLGQTPDDVLNVYKLKWQKNLDRQANDYDVRNKTEEDNQAIIAQITNGEKLNE
jgi:dUTPase